MTDTPILVPRSQVPEGHFVSTPPLRPPCSVTQGQAESGGMVLVAYAGPARPAAALRDSVLRLPTDIHSLLVNTPSSSSSPCSACSSTAASSSLNKPKRNLSSSSSSYFPTPSSFLLPPSSFFLSSPSSCTPCFSFCTFCSASSSLSPLPTVS